MGIIPVGTEEPVAGRGHMLDQARQAEAENGNFVEFVTAGTSVTGEYHCSSCGYGVTLHAELPTCPMCAGTTWEPHAWSPFTRAQRLQ
jgi:hypothetical protein